jgi:hypothetical protein
VDGREVQSGWLDSKAIKQSDVDAALWIVTAPVTEVRAPVCAHLAMPLRFEVLLRQQVWSPA